MKACRKIDDFRRNDIQFCSFQVDRKQTIFSH